MKDEEYLEITNRISNIKTLIEKKHPQPAGLHFDYKRIIQEREDKQTYLSKQSKTLEMLRQLPQGHHERKDIIVRSRSKIQQFHNEFEELEQCINDRNKTRAKKVKEEERLYMQRLAKKILEKQQPEEEGEKESDSYSRPEPSRREGSASTSNHPFQTVKVEKFLQVYKDYLRRHKQDPKHKFRFPGVGFEYTPLYQLLKQGKKQKGKENNPTEKQGKSKRYLRCTLDAVYGRQKAMLGSEKVSKNRKSLINPVFQSRIRQIKAAEEQLASSYRPV